MANKLVMVTSLLGMLGILILLFPASHGMFVMVGCDETSVNVSVSVGKNDIVF